MLFECLEIYSNLRNKHKILLLWFIFCFIKRLMSYYFTTPRHQPSFRILFLGMCRFSHLSCFTSDVEMFLHTLTDTEKADILQKFEKSSESPLASPLKTLGRAITLFKLRELFGVNLTLPLVGLLIRPVNMTMLVYLVWRCSFS